MKKEIMILNWSLALLGCGVFGVSLVRFTIYHLASAEAVGNMDMLITIVAAFPAIISLFGLIIANVMLKRKAVTVAGTNSILALEKAKTWFKWSMILLIGGALVVIAVWTTIALLAADKSTSITAIVLTAINSLPSVAGISGLVLSSLKFKKIATT